MKKIISEFSRIFILTILATLSCNFKTGFAQQQQNANAYTFWDFGKGANDIENVEQKIWIALPAPSSQWVITWKWTADPAHGGYLGFNTDKDGKAQALFSLWNATEATGDSCLEFGGEGSGWSCRSSFEIKSDIFYQLRLARTKSEADGVWWGAWIVENPVSDSPKEYFLGEIKVKSEMNMIEGNSINNFSEYYGQTQDRCSSVPLSIFGVTPPQANKDGNGNYNRTSKFNGSSDPKQNPCQSGDEPQGALFKVENYDFGSLNGALIFLGGTASEHTLPENVQSPSE